MQSSYQNNPSTATENKQESELRSILSSDKPEEAVMKLISRSKEKDKNSRGKSNFLVSSGSSGSSCTNSKKKTMDSL